MEKTWIELQVEVDASLLEAAVNFLIEEGSPGVRQEEISGSRQRVYAYFSDDRSRAAKGQRIRSYFRSLCKTSRTPCNLRLRVIRDEKWAESWKANFRPLRVTPSLVIKPPWESYTPTPGERVIEIDPGMAFGTGSHPSTQICLGFLEKTIPVFPGHPSVLDVGTGSGILAIAARKLGAEKIVGIDIDPIAVENARKNASANRAAKGIHFRVSSPQRLRGHFDIVIANLLPQELLPLSSFLPGRLKERGTLILSGFLTRQKKEIALAFAGGQMKVINSRQARGWAGFLMKKAR
jgi:ribosomal protein L11 methyltransferase